MVVPFMSTIAIGLPLALPFSSVDSSLLRIVIVPKKLRERNTTLADGANKYHATSIHINAIGTTSTSSAMRANQGDCNGPVGPFVDWTAFDTNSYSNSTSVQQTARKNVNGHSNIVLNTCGATSETAMPPSAP